MLVLNSGQIPWGLDKQLEVVFKPILKRLKYRVPYLDKLISNKIYKQAEIVELFLAFTSRKVRIDKKQQLAEYHAALDIMSLIREKSGHIIDKFEEIFSSLPEEQLNVGKYATYELLNSNLQHYLKIKNSIDLLEKKENGI
jgi:hypothetical protein